MALGNYSEEELLNEMKNRGKTVQVHTSCPTCRNWTAYMGCSRSWREELHCFGCRRPVENCTCRR